MKKYKIAIILFIVCIGLFSFSKLDYLRMLADVNISNIGNGQVLRYNSTTSKWDNADNAASQCGVDIVKKYSADPTGVMDFSEAVNNAIASGTNCIYIPKGRYKLDRANRLTIPDSVELIMQKGAVINVTAGDTLYIKSEFKGGLSQYFTDANTLKRGVQFDNRTTPIVYAEWWGAKPDGTLATQTRKAFQSAFNSTLLTGSVGNANAAGIHVHAPGQYQIDSTIRCFAPNVEFSGNLNAISGVGGSYVGTRFRCTSMPAGTVNTPKWMFNFQADNFNNTGSSPTSGIQAASGSVKLNIHDITLYGNSSPYGTPNTDYIGGVFTGRTAFINVERCHFIKLYDGFMNVFGIFTNVENCNFSENFRDAYSSPRFNGSFTTTTWIENNEFAGSGRYHIFLDNSGGSGQANRIFSNDFEAKSTGNYFASRPSRFYLGIVAGVCLIGQNDLQFNENRFEADAARHNVLISNGSASVTIKGNLCPNQLGGYSPNRSPFATAYSSGLDAGATAFLAANGYLDIDTLRNGILAAGIAVSEMTLDANRTDVTDFLYIYGTSLNTGTVRSGILNQTSSIVDVPIVSNAPNYAGKTEASKAGWAFFNTFGTNAYTNNKRAIISSVEFSAYQDIITQPYTNPYVLRYTAQSGQQKRVIWAQAAPTAEAWNKGDKIINSDPDSGEPSEWVCTVAGTPGTWVGVNTIP